MTIVITIYCDQENRYGVCARRSLPGRTLDEARQLAEDDGWLLHDGRDLCPGHCGGKPRRSGQPSVTPLRRTPEVT